MHADQLHPSVELVRDLVDDQFPRWRTLPIAPVSSYGTVNALFRIGDDLVARFPRQHGDPETVRRVLESEARAARELSGQTRFCTPEPVAIGEPGAGYPLPWSVQTWVPGADAPANASWPNRHWNTSRPSLSNPPANTPQIRAVPR